MASISQYDKLEEQALKLQKKIIFLQNPKLRNINQGQMNRIKNDSLPIITTIENLRRFTEFNSLYSSLCSLLKSCKNMLDKVPLDESLAGIIYDIKLQTTEALCDLNIEMNLEQIQTNTEISNKLKEIEEKEKTTAYHLLKSEEILKSIESKSQHISMMIEDNSIKLNIENEKFKNKISGMENSIKYFIEDKINLISSKVESSENHNLQFTDKLLNTFNKTSSKLSALENDITKNLIDIKDSSFQELKIEIERQQLTTEDNLKKYQHNIISSLESSLTTSLNVNQSQMNEHIERFKNELSASQSELEKDISIKKKSLESNIRDEIKLYVKLKLTMERTLKEKIDKVEKKISVITSGVMADQHIKQANTERNVFWFFQILGFIFLCAAIYAGSAFFSELTNIRIPFFPKPDLVVHVDGGVTSMGTSTFLIFLRISMIILLTAPAMYLLKEAALHRHKENIYRQRGIQLATISPYLEELDKEERAAIKKELVTSFFQFHDGKVDTKNIPDFIRDMKEAVSIAKSINSPTPKRKSTILGKGSK